MRIGLYNGSTLYPLAGQYGVSERTHSSAADLDMSPTAVMQVAQLVRATHALHIDRGNLAYSVSFTTTRKFSTPTDAELWWVDYDRNFPRDGKLIMETDGSVRVMAAAVVSPPHRRVTGATVLLTYTANGGAITNAVHATATINPSGADNSILYTAVMGGPPGNNVSITYVISGVGTAVSSVAVVGNAITITAQASAPASAVITAVNADAAASALVTAAASGAVTGAIAAVTATNLTGGAY